MKLGTIVYDNKIYNLDYMDSSDIGEILQKIHKNASENISDTIVLEAKLNRLYAQRQSEEIVRQKVNHQLRSIEISINQINPKFNEKSKKYDIVQDEIEQILADYEKVLMQYAYRYDIKIEKMIYQKAELMYDTSQNKKELRQFSKKMNDCYDEKRRNLYGALEVGGQSISVTIKKPRRIKNIARTIRYKFNTYQVIIKNVLEPLKQRIDEFKINQLEKTNIKIPEIDLKKVEKEVLKGEKNNMKKSNVKSQSGAISAFVMLAMMFFLFTILGIYMITSKRAQTQTESLGITQDMYSPANIETVYNAKIANAQTVIPIYTKEQLWSMGTNQAVEIDGIVYEFTANANYELQNDIIINIEELTGRITFDETTISHFDKNDYEIYYYSENQEHYYTLTIETDEYDYTDGVNYYNIKTL